MITAVISTTFAVAERKPEKMKDDHSSFNSTLHIYDFHIFITSSSSFHRFIMDQFNDLLPVGLLA